LRARRAGPTEDQLFLVLTLIIGAVAGLTIVAFVALTEHLGKRLLTASAVERLLSPFIEPLVGGLLLWRFFPGARGAGFRRRGWRCCGNWGLFRSGGWWGSFRVRRLPGHPQPRRHRRAPPPPPPPQPR